MNFYDPVPRRGWRSEAPRPPWSDEAAIRKACTSCNKCIEACPQAILFAGPAGTPVINFKAGECTFCGKCAEACPEPVFRNPNTRPWANLAEIGASCLLANGVECRICTEMCEERALRFDLTVRPVGRIHLDAEACTGCGACVSGCPVSAISIKSAPMEEAVQ